MKKIALLFFIAGLLGGFAVGHGSKAPPEAQPPTPTVKPQQIAKPEPARPIRSKEQGLLLQAINELNLTFTELEDAQAYIQKLERNTKRYNWLMDYWKENGFGTSYRMNFRYGQYKPSDELIEFFGWDEEQVAAMGKIGKESTKEIKDWEGQNSICIEDSEDKLVYEIEAMPQEIADQYLQAMAEILDQDDWALLSSKLEKQFESTLKNRTATLTIGPAPANMQRMNSKPDQEHLIIEIKPVQDKSAPFDVGTSTSYTPYTPGKTIPYQWNHVFHM